MTSRAHPRTLSTLTVLAMTALGVAACGSSSSAVPVGGSDAAPSTSSAPTTSTSSAHAPVAVEEQGEAQGAGQTGLTGQATSVLLDGTRRVDVELYTGQWLVPDVEGGLTAVDQPARADLPSSWVFTPVSPEATEHLVVTEATTDGEPMCLRVVDVETVSLSRCDPADPAQLVRVAALDSPEQVNITTAEGFLVSGTDGRLAIAASPDDPNSVFTLAERGLNTRS